MELNERIAKYLCACPGAVSGQGGHNQTFAVACNLSNGFALSEEDTLYWLQQYNVRCSPQWSDAELAHKAKSACNASHDKPRGHLIGDGNSQESTYRAAASSALSPHMAKQVTQLRKFTPEECLNAFLGDFTCNELDLYTASPIKPNEDFTQDGWTLVMALYHPGELINFVTDFRVEEGTGKANPCSTGETVERDILIARWQIVGMPESDCGGWMRMNPLDGQGAKDSNVTAYRFALLEFDNIPTEKQMSLFAKLPLPIAALLTSGGKSVHAWVRIDAPDVEQYRDQVGRLMKLLSRFGLDGKNKNPARLSRLVGVTRKYGAYQDGRQRLLYLNPNPQQRAIL